MTPDDLHDFYRAYIACLNRQDWPNLRRYVGEAVRYNGASIGLDGYRAMLVGDFEAVPDLAFNIELIVAEPPTVASRLAFDCTPVGTLFGLPVNGRRVRFTENVIYEVQEGAIRSVWSVIDKAAVAAQIRDA